VGAVGGFGADSVCAGNLILNRYTARSVSLFFAFGKPFFKFIFAGCYVLGPRRYVSGPIVTGHPLGTRMDARWFYVSPLQKVYEGWKICSDGRTRQKSGKSKLYYASLGAIYHFYHVTISH
jgi:hypothetical protein